MPESSSTPAAPMDVGTPRVEVASLANGRRTWKIVVPAADASEDALRVAKDLALKIDGELAVHYEGTR